MKFYYKLNNRILVLLLFIIISSCGKDKTNEVAKLTEDKDSIEGLDITGEWRLKTPNTNNHLFINKDNTWKMVFENYEKDTLIEKGKYVIAKDSAVFFRYFGSQHWPNPDTINDIKTSIGAFVLFLTEKNELKDNQEDYAESYLKID